MPEVSNFGNGFDVVNASWFYDSMSSEEELLQAARSARHCLKEGGMHTGVTIHFDIRPTVVPEWREFGISLLYDKPEHYRPVDSELIHAKFLLSEERSCFAREASELLLKSCYFSEATYRRVFREVGFRRFDFIPPTRWPPPVSNLTGRERQKWERYVKGNPEMIGFRAFA